MIAMGCDCEKLLRKYFSNSLCAIKRIKHYSYRYQKDEEVFKEISDSLDKILEEYK